MFRFSCACWSCHRANDRLNKHASQNFNAKLVSNHLRKKTRSVYSACTTVSRAQAFDASNDRFVCGAFHEHDVRSPRVEPFPSRKSSFAVRRRQRERFCRDDSSPSRRRFPRSRGVARRENLSRASGGDGAFNLTLLGGARGRARRRFLPRERGASAQVRSRRGARDARARRDARYPRRRRGRRRRRAPRRLRHE